MRSRASRPLLRTLIACLLVFAVPVQAQGVRVTGVGDQLRQNIELHLGKTSVDRLEQSQRLQRRLEETVARALEPFGYYQSSVSFRFDAQPIELRVDPGPRMKLADVDIRVDGAASGDPAVGALVKQSAVRSGAPLDHATYDTLKQDLLDLCRELGYLDARWEVARLEVNLEEYVAKVTLYLDTGERYRVGAIRYSGSALEPDLLAAMTTLAPGDPLDRDRVKELERRLRNTAYFKSVVVDAVAAGERQADIEVQLVDDESQGADLGVGYSTDTGLRIIANYRNPLIGTNGHSFEMQSEISDPEQNLTASYRIPAPDPLDEFQEITAGLGNSNTEDTKWTTGTVGWRRHAHLAGHWRWNWGASLEGEKYTVGEESEKEVLYLMPGVSFSDNTLQAGIDPRFGHHHQLILDTSTTGLGADVSFVRARGVTKWLFGLGDGNTTMLLRAEAGAVFTEDIDQIPASLRFYTGGDNTIRGYDLNAISPEDDNGDLVGGKYLGVGSVEVSRRFWPRWRLAMFMDAGDAFRDSPDSLYKSVGVGARWLSPVGQIRVDVAFPIQDDDKSGVHFHISMGPPL